MKGRSQMTSTVFGYDHIMMRAEYRTPDPHSHLAVHFIAGLDGPVHCVVSGDSFDADAVFIASDVVHTAYAETGDMLVFLFDTAGSIAEEAQKQYLCGRPYFCGDKETVEKLREIWKNNPPAQADSLITQLLGLDTVGNTLRDERISQVLEYLRSLDEVPEDITAQLCAKVCLSPSRLSHLSKKMWAYPYIAILPWIRCARGISISKSMEISPKPPCVRDLILHPILPPPAKECSASPFRNL